MGSVTVTRAALFLAFLCAAATADADPYDQRVDDFSGETTYTSDKIAKSGGGLSLIGADSNVRIAKVAAPGQPDRYSFRVRAVTSTDSRVLPESVLQVKIGDQVHQLPADYSHDYIERRSDYLYRFTELRYPAELALLDALAAADAIAFRIQHEAGNVTLEVRKRKQFKRIEEFLAAVRE